MSILATAKDLSKSFGVRPLFQGVCFTLGEGERVGLIGPNGAGKSTLLRILARLDSPDSGTLALRRGLRVGHLAQVPTFVSGRTVREVVMEPVSTLSDPELHWQASSRADELIARFGLAGPQAGADTPVDRLSGGWRKRVALARELVREPELLLLDEPTNHLDVDSILWLEDLLASARFATVTVTHDRLFLQRIANRILELDRRNAGGLLAVEADYATFLERKAELMAAQEQREASLRNCLRREVDWLRRGAPARTTKQQARIQRAASLVGEVDELSARNEKRSVGIDFASIGRSPKRLIEARGISKSYGEHRIFQGLDIFVGPGSRLGIMGPNGCGKSTLLRVLVGQESPDSGSILTADNLQVAYFQQHREALDPDSTVAASLCPAGGEQVDFRGTRVHVNGYLARFLFRQEHHALRVGQLSGGEQSRLALARLMLRPANVLVLDEPTNDLDMATLELFEESLIEFDGAVLLVTHDRAFLDRVTNQILAFNTAPGQTGQITRMVGLGQWEAWHEQQSEVQSEAVPKPAPRACEPSVRRKLSYKDQRDFDTIEERIAQAEATLFRLRAEQGSPEVSSHATRLLELETEVAAAQAEVDALFARWAELEALSSSFVAD